MGRRFCSPRHTRVSIHNREQACRAVGAHPDASGPMKGGELGGVAGGSGVKLRSLAQPGRALGSGPRGRWFKSTRPDQILPKILEKSIVMAGRGRSQSGVFALKPVCCLYADRTSRSALTERWQSASRMMAGRPPAISLYKIGRCSSLRARDVASLCEITAAPSSCRVTIAGLDTAPGSA